MRYVCNFSCGAASAVATKLTIGEYGLSHEVLVVNAYLASEHPDNRRFLADCEAWFGRPITVVRDVKYNADAYEVFRKRRYTKGRYGAACSKALKREVIDSHFPPRDGDMTVLGYTAEEHERFDDWIDANADRRAIAPLIDNKLGKADVLAMVERAGIELPLMYRMGYHNANCIGCVKGGAGYWNKIRRDFPEKFEEMAQIEELIGPSAYLFRHRSGPLKGKRFPLRELPPTMGRYEDEPDISCSAACEFVEGSDAWDELREENIW